MYKFLFYFLLYQTSVYALEPAVYPVVPQNRLMGTNQGSIPSCAANADMTALEHAFAAKKLPINFSQYYRHECVYINAVDAKRKEMCLQAVTPEDKCIYKNIGEFAPEYMFPEDNEGNELIYASGSRPPAKMFGVFNGMPHLNEFGFSREHFTFGKDKEGRDYGNTKTVMQMLAEFSEGKAVTVSLHSALFDTLLNSKTGLVLSKYVKDTFIKEAAQSQYRESADPRTNYLEGINHSVAVVGYDLNFYAEHQYAQPGAIFVRNSWNTNSLKGLVNSPSSAEELVDLGKFRAKFYGRNLPGYYAIPIQYFMDLEGDKTQFDVTQLNFTAYFNKYREVQKDYETASLPYFCEVTYKENGNTYTSLGGVQNVLRSYVKAREGMRDAPSSEKEANSRKNVLNSLEELSDESSQRGIKFAKFAIYKGDNAVVRKFYAGDFNEFYCSKNALIAKDKINNVTIVKNQVWPTLKMYDESEILRSAIEKLGRNSAGITGRVQFADVLSSEITNYKIGE